MKTASQILLYIHIIAGVSSLIVFWIPALNRKGSVNHVRIGKLYVWLMGIVVVTAAVLSIKNWILGYTQIAVFLGFLSLITANPLWKGVAILNQKSSLRPSFLLMQLLIDGLIFLAGVGLIIYGIVLEGKGVAVLMFIFGALGISNLPSLIRQIRQPAKKADWMIVHLQEMLTTGIAAYTAFFAFGGRRLLGHIFTDYWMVIPWVAPTVIGIIAIRILKRKYLNKRTVARA